MEYAQIRLILDSLLKLAFVWLHIKTGTLIVAKVNPLYSWLKNFLKQRCLDRPDERPLYSYRISDEEFEDLEVTLRTFAPNRLHGPIRFINYSEPLFCLYCSEWIRRFHNEGNPRWDDPIQSIGWPTLGNQQITSLVDKGITYWRRPIRNKGKIKGYLHTLACEGGLPLRMIENQSGSLTPYFRRILRELRTQVGDKSPYDIAEQHAISLPQSLQIDLVYEVASELCLTLTDLLRRGERQRGDRLTKLRSVSPVWYEELPLVMSEQDAEGLIRSLFDESASSTRIRRTISVVRRWQEGENLWYCDAKFQFPLSLTTEQLLDLFDLSKKPEGNRLVIKGQWLGGNRPLALLSQSNDSQWMVETYPAAQKMISGAAALSEFEISLNDGPVILGRSIPFGGMALSETLPWVMDPVNSDASVLKLLGVGSVTSSKDSAFVALPPGSSLEPPMEDPRNTPHIIDDCERSLVEVSGTYKVVLEERAECVIRTGAEDDDTYHYLIRGNRQGSVESNYPIYCGVPNLFRTDGTTLEHIPASQVVWCSLKSGHKQWHQLVEQTPTGQIELRHEVDGTVLHSSKLAILPANSHFQFNPVDTQSGQINIQRIGAVEIYYNNQGIDSDLRISSESDGYTLECNSLATYPKPLDLHFQWADGNLLALRVPFPATGGRFVGADHQARSHGFVATNRLQEVMAEAVVLQRAPNIKPLRLALDAQLNEDGVPLRQLLRLNFPLDVSPDGGVTKRCLIEHQHQLMSLMSCSARLDAELTMEFSLQTDTENPVLTIRRYDCGFIIDRPFLRFDGTDSFSLTDEQKKLISVRAVSLLYPEQGIVELQAEEQGFNFEELQPESGPWLAWGSVDGVARIRPTILMGGKEDKTLSSLRSAIIEANPKLREEKVQAHLAYLETNPTSEEWHELICYLGALKEIPAAALDLNREIVARPRCLLTLLINATLMMQLEQIWALQNELPFNWGWLETDDWLQVVVNYSSALRKNNSNDSSTLQSLAMFVSLLSPKAVQDYRVNLPISLIIDRLNKYGVTCEQVKSPTEEQFEKAKQDLARMTSSFGKTYTRDADKWLEIFFNEQNKQLSKVLVRDKYNKVVDQLINTMVAAAAMTAYRHPLLPHFSKVFELVYQQAPEQLSVIFHFYQRFFREQ